MPELSVVVPTHDNAAGLDRLLASLERQADPGAGWEVVVVDNNCTDATPQVVARHAARGRIPGLRRLAEPIQGARAARCRGVAETSAPLVAFVDDDNVLDPGWIAAALVFLASHARAGAVGGRIVHVFEDEPSPLVLEYAYGLSRQDYGEAPRRLAATGVVWLITAGLVARRAALEASGWLAAGYLAGRTAGRLTAGEDTELVLRIRRAGWELWYEPALRQEHHVPRHRMSVDHLCRVFRGNCRTDVIFDAMAMDAWPGVSWRWRYLGRELAAFTWGGARYAAKRLLGRAVPRDRVRAAQRHGRLRGALDLALDGRGLGRFEGRAPATAARERAAARLAGP
jgi:glycosyltransferase involved in cell wall biosynthesis